MGWTEARPGGHEGSRKEENDMNKYETATTPEQITTASLETLVGLWEQTNAAPFSLDLATVRGWLMDELERRDPDGFNAWLEQDTPEDSDLWQFILAARA